MACGADALGGAAPFPNPRRGQVTYFHKKTKPPECDAGLDKPRRKMVWTCWNCGFQWVVDLTDPKREKQLPDATQGCLCDGCLRDWKPPRKELP
jgi:hypothetical protein